MQLEIAHVGGDAEAEAELAGVRECGSVVLDDIRRRPLGELVVDIPAAPGWSGGILLDELGADAVGALLSIAGPDRDAPFFAVQLRHLGGALREPQGTANAVGGRDAEYLLFLLGAPVPELIDDVVPGVARAVFAALTPWATGCLQVNFADHAGEAELGRAWTAETRAELAAIRADWDPTGMFALGGAR